METQTAFYRNHQLTMGQLITEIPDSLSMPMIIIEDYINNETPIITESFLTENEIIEIIQKPNNFEDNESDNETPPAPIVTFKQASDGLQLFLNFCEQQPDNDDEINKDDLVIFRKYVSIMKQKSIKNMKQKSIDSFFTSSSSL